MKKMMFATLALVCMFAVAGGNATPSAAAAPTAPEIGTCRWFCGPSTKPFTTASACAVACATTCEAIC